MASLNQTTIQETISPRQFVTFMLEDETYGVDIDKVQEIIGYQGFTRVPQQPGFMPGLLNLRGLVVPVVDLRLKFGLNPRPYDRYTVILIIRLRSRILGLLVDAVADVLSVDPGGIQAPPQYAGPAGAGFIEGLCQLEDRLLIILDVDRVLGETELKAMERLG